MRFALLIVSICILLLPMAAMAETPAATTQEFSLRMSQHAEQLEETFDIPCTDAVKRQVMGDSVMGVMLLSEISENCGIVSYSYRETKDGVHIANCVYYEGQRMLYAYRTGNTGFLTARERQALTVAQQIAAGAQGDALARERYIHDALCQRTAYQTDDRTGHLERDGALGPLLNGEADCDGYSDAFFLLGNMAGLNVRYQHGEATNLADPDLGDAKIKSGRHMWNLVNVNGQWAMMDVTWDDGNETPSHLYFNFDTQQAAATHRWDAQALAVTPAASVGNESRPGDLARTWVTSWDEVYVCLRQFARDRSGRVCLSFPERLGLRQDNKQLSALIYAVGVDSYHWSLGATCAEIFDLSYADYFGICESQADAAAFLQQCAALGIRHFRLCFGPYLGPQMMADDRRLVSDLLDRSSLADTRFRYSTDSWYIEVENAAYTAPMPQFDNLNALAEYARQQGLSGASQFTVVLVGGLDVDQAMQSAASALRRTGANSVSGSTLGARLTIYISYYPEFAMVQTRQEALNYLSACRARGVRTLCIYFPDALFQQLLENNSAGFFDLLSQAGIGNRSVSRSVESCYFMIENIEW